MEPALRALTARRERELGDHPSPETLAVYHEGGLEVGEAERLRDHLALCAECTQLLLDLAAFPELEPAPGTRSPTAGDVEAAWQGMRERLGGGAAAPSNVVHLPQAKPAAPLEPRSHRVWAWALAASWLVAAGLGVWVVELQRENARLAAPSGDVVIADLTADGDVTRGEPQSAEALPPGKPLVLTLDAPGAATHASYEADLVSAAGTVLWTGKNLPRGDASTFNLNIPAGFLRSGRYSVRLYGVDAGKRQPLASFSLPIGAP